MAVALTGGRPQPRDRLADKLTLASGGDEGAFAEVYGDTAHGVFVLALRVTGDSDQAEEVAWVMSLAHRLAVERVRSMRAGQCSGSEEARTSPLPQALVGLSEPERRSVETLTRLGDALRSMGEQN